jgi:D-alanyl-D-alanine carboxypeptidase
MLIGVVLHSTATKPGARFTDARRMLSWGFSILAASGALTSRLSRPDP